MIDAGQLRHRIRFEKYVGEPDVFGDPRELDETSWAEVCSPMAAIKPLSGREFYEAQQSQSEVTHKIIIRCRRDINTAMRIRYGERIFGIVSIIDFEERHESLTLMAKELVD